MAVNALVVLVGLVAVAAATKEVAFMMPCATEPLDACNVTEVRIDPCPDHAKQTCTLKRGQYAHMEFEFIPNFSATNLKAGVFYKNSPFSGMENDDGCLLTTCPTVAGEKQQFSYDLRIGKKLPSGQYATQWKVWNGDDPSQMCCFVTNVKLPKNKK